MFTIFQDIFTQLDEFRAFELLRSGLDRTRYLCVKEAKIIAMTCTHAALKRKELVTMGFKYDNILMEESAQVSTPTMCTVGGLNTECVWYWDG